MKQFFSFGIIFVAIFSIFVSCGSKNEEKQNAETIAEETFRNGLSNTDSLCVLNLADSIMNLFQSGNLDAAIGCISFLDENGAIHDLPDDRIKQLRKQFTFFPVYEYTITNLQFNTAEQNIVTFQITFEEPKPGQKPSLTSFALSPIKVDGKWYLTVRQSSTGDGHNTDKNLTESDN